MSKQIQIELPIELDWEGITFNGEVYKQYSPTKVELNIKHILDLNNKGKLQYFFIIPRRREYIELANIGVDLQTGLFHLNGLKLDMRPELFKVEGNVIIYRLIFFRRKRGEITTFETKNLDAKIHRYLLGWQATVDGQNYQRIMFINPFTLEIEIKEKR